MHAARRPAVAGSGRWSAAWPGGAATLAAVMTCVLLFAGCSADGTDSAPPAAPVAPSTAPATTSTSRSASPSAPGPTSRPTSTPAVESAADLAGMLAAAAAERTPWAARYGVESTDPARPDAQVAVAVAGSSLRLDLTQQGATSTLIVTPAGAVSCQVAGTERTCLDVAGPGQPVPALFDPGLQRVFTTDLAALAAGTAGAVTGGVRLPAAGALPAAECFTVSGPGVDPGDYCLSRTGILRRASFPSGRLSLVSTGAAPDAAAFTAPVAPSPLPTPCILPRPPGSSVTSARRGHGVGTTHQGDHRDGVEGLAVVVDEAGHDRGADTWPSPIWASDDSKPVT